MSSEPTRAEVDAWPGPTVLEFGTSWCPIRRAARPIIDRALAHHPDLRYLRVEDGPGQPLGRSFRVKLWPTVIVVRGGAELARVVRPDDEPAVAAVLAAARAT